MKKKIKDKKAKREIFPAVKKSLSDIGKSFSQGADKMADILLDNREKKVSTKIKRLKEESFSVIKDVTFSIKNNLKNVKPMDLLCGASYQTGRLSRITKDTCVEIFNDLME
jgi:hypothetical protein